MAWMGWAHRSRVVRGQLDQRVIEDAVLVIAASTRSQFV
jgi:hypothetical protein